MRQIAPRSVVSLLLIALRSADVNSRPSIGLCHWQWFMSGHEYWQRFRGFVGVSCFRRKMLLFEPYHLSATLSWDNVGNALLNAADLLVFLRVDTFVSTLFSKACVYFHNYSLRCYLKISKRCGDSYISRRVRKEKKTIRFQRFFFLHDSKRRMNWNNSCYLFSFRWKRYRNRFQRWFPNSTKLYKQQPEGINIFFLEVTACRSSLVHYV